MKALEAAVYSALNVSAVTTLAPGGVHHTLAPDGTAYPYVRVQWQGGVTDWTLGRQVSDTVDFDVIAVVKGCDTNTLADLKAAVDGCLNDVALTVSGKTLWLLRKTGSIPTYSERGADGVVRLYGGCSYRAIVAA